LQNVLADLSPDVRKRIFALKKLQMDTIKLDAEFHASVYDLEQKFQGKHDDIFKKRSEIVNGIHQPTDDECKLPGVEIKFDQPAEGQEKISGIPQFWLAVLKNVNEMRTMIQEYDEDVLKHLIDLRAFSKPSPDLSFQLEFHFEPNEYFQNSVLTKTYLMKCCPDVDDPFSFEGPEIYKSIGCEIMWNVGKNVAEKSVKKKDSSLRFFKTESFFNFFNPPELKAGDSEESDKIEVRFHAWKFFVEK
jgi:Nucleosome assembly protein (NAP)